MSKTALVTGGAKRIGRSVSVEIARMGYDVAIHYNSSHKEAAEAKSEVEKLGVKCKLFRHDLSKAPGASSLMDEVTAEFPDLSVLVNNASTFREIRFAEVTEQSFNADLNVNFRSPFFLCQSFAKNVSRGLIINMLDSRISKVHNAHFVYNLSKKSLHHLTLMLAKELAPDIRVNAVCPGPILPAPGEDLNRLKEIASKIPLGEIGDTSYINQAVRYLITSEFTTGEVLFVDGGQHL